MKKYLLITIATLALTIAEKQTFAQGPEWVWAQSAGGTDDDYGSNVSTDAGGNVYITGFFYSDSITFGSTILTNKGHHDIYLTKYDSNGTVLWAKSAGGTDPDYAYSVATDAAGNVYLTGYFYSPSITFGSTVLTNGGAFGDIFITKYDSNGTVLWAKSEGGISDDVAYSVSTDNWGNVYVTGFFYSDSITFGSTILTNKGHNDIYLTKYDSNGTVLWAKSAGGTDDDRVNSVSIDEEGNVFITGYFWSPSITFSSTTLTNAGAGYADIFITKYDSTGTVLWAESAGGTIHDYAISVSTDAGGNVYVTGLFQSSSITFGSTVLTNANEGYGDIFITKYDSNGTVIWAKSAEGISSDYGYGVSTDAGRNVYVTGSFFSSSITFGSTVLSNAGGADIFITKYDSNGTVLWAKSAGGTDYDWANSVSTDTEGNVYVMGEFGSPSITFGSTTLINAGGTDIFTAKVSTTVATGIEENNFIDEITVFPNPFSFQAILQTGNLLHNATLTVDNVFGQTVKQIKSINGQTIVLSRVNLVRGLYFLRLTENNKTIATKKIVITD